MVAFLVKDFGGEVPRRDARLLPDNMAARATNCDLASGPLDGLPQPEFVHDFGSPQAPAANPLPVTLPYTFAQPLPVPFPVRKAYRFPGPTADDPDVWMPLPSEFSSVCKSPLANDTAHRIYWTNPPGSPDAGVWWNTYDRIKNGDPHWSLGFNAPTTWLNASSAPTTKLTVSVQNGLYPDGFYPSGDAVGDPGVGYAPGDTITLAGGILYSEPSVTAPLSFTVAATQVGNIAVVSGGAGGTSGQVLFTGTTGVGSSFQFYGLVASGVLTSQAFDLAIVSGGTGGTDGVVHFTGTTGTGIFLVFNGTVSNGVLLSIDEVLSAGADDLGGGAGIYLTNPTNPAYEPVSGIGAPTGAAISMTMLVNATMVTNGIYATNPTNINAELVTGTGAPAGATVSFTMGVIALSGGNPSGYSTPPDNPASTTSSGAGTGCTLIIDYISGPPLEARSYVFTYIDVYNQESSPCLPSDIVEGPSDGEWLISGFPLLPPPSPDAAGNSYPPPVKMRLYRTLAGNTTGGQFFFVDDIEFGSGTPPGTYVDIIPNTTIVNNNQLETASWAPPPGGLDGLIAMTGGMLIGFTGNTVHFCEPDRPHTWPAGYDQSVLYPIVAFAVWQQSLVVLTQGFPSTGTGNSPAQFTFAQVQAPEPCIARGSVVTDLAGVYYASQNGLIALNYYGAQNQTLSNLTRQDWLTRFQAKNLVSCRHRAQYLAINGTGMGFLIDYTEERMGVCFISPFVNVVSVWNDVFTGDAYMVADNIVYRWDSTVTPSLIYRWRSREFYMQAPSSLGACQISLDPSVSDTPAPDAIPTTGNASSALELPPGINALFRLMAGPSQQVVHEQWLYQPREIFRLPSGRKAFNWQFEIIARVPVHSVELASTMRELKTV